MRKTEGRTIGLYFKVSPEEMALIEKKMEQAGISVRTCGRWRWTAISSTWIWRA